MCSSDLLSTGLGIEKADRNNGTYDILINKSSATKLYKETAVPNLHVITANENLLGLDIELANSSDRATRLRESLLEELNYDFILLDCPPALNILTINALVASEGALVPLQAEFYALEGLSQLIKTINKIRNTITSKLKLEGIILTM